MKKACLALLLGTLFICPLIVAGQAFRYIDESGNIHFVDSVSQVPERYRYQVLAPTPVQTGKPRAQYNTPIPRPTKIPKPTHTPKATKTPKPANENKSSFFPNSAPQKPQYAPTPAYPPGYVAPVAPLPAQPAQPQGVPQAPAQLAPGSPPPA